MNKKFKNKIIKDIGNKRYEHSERVQDLAIELAKHYSENTEKAANAAIFHDCGKLKDKTQMDILGLKLGVLDFCSEPGNQCLLHCFVGEHLAKECYGVKDRDVLDAIRYHTTGRAGMSLLEKIIYLADYCEPGRENKYIDRVRKVLFQNIDKSMLLAINNTLDYLNSNKEDICEYTIEAKSYFEELLRMGEI